MFFHLTLPIQRDDLREIERTLERDDLFTTSFEDRGPAKYKAVTYLSEQAAFGTRTNFLLDRNILSSLVALGSGAEVKSRHQSAAAVLAFAQCIDALVEPTMALYELGDVAVSESPQDELHVFRRMDNSNPQLFADVANKRLQHLDADKLSQVDASERPINFMTTLGRWQANYVVVLKIASLELEPGTSEAKFTGLLQWLHSDFLFSAPAFCMAAIYFAPNTRRGGLLKGLRSSDRLRAAKGIRNAAWDLALLSEWLKRIEVQQNDNALCVLVSADRFVKMISRVLVGCTSRHPPVENPLERWMIWMWGERYGRSLVKLYRELELQGSDPKRALNSGMKIDGILQMIAEMEGRIREHVS